MSATPLSICCSLCTYRRSTIRCKHFDCELPFCSSSCSQLFHDLVAKPIGPRIRKLPDGTTVVEEDEESPEGSRDDEPALKRQATEQLFNRYADVVTQALQEQPQHPATAMAVDVESPAPAAVATPQESPAFRAAVTGFGAGSWASLPMDVRMLIMLRLPVLEIIANRRVDKRTHQLVLRQDLWRNLCLKGAIHKVFGGASELRMRTWYEQALTIIGAHPIVILNPIDKRVLRYIPPSDTLQDYRFEVRCRGQEHWELFNEMNYNTIDWLFHNIPPDPIVVLHRGDKLYEFLRTIHSDWQLTQTHFDNFVARIRVWVKGERDLKATTQEYYYHIPAEVVLRAARGHAILLETPTARELKDAMLLVELDHHGSPDTHHTGFFKWAIRPGKKRNDWVGIVPADGDYRPRYDFIHSRVDQAESTLKFMRAVTLSTEIPSEHSRHIDILFSSEGGGVMQAKEIPHGIPRRSLQHLKQVVFRFYVPADHLITPSTLPAMEKWMKSTNIVEFIYQGDNRVVAESKFYTELEKYTHAWVEAARRPDAVLIHQYTAPIVSLQPNTPFSSASYKSFDDATYTFVVPCYVGMLKGFTQPCWGIDLERAHLETTVGHQSIALPTDNLDSNHNDKLYIVGARMIQTLHKQLTDKYFEASKIKNAKTLAVGSPLRVWTDFVERLREGGYVPVEVPSPVPDNELQGPFDIGKMSSGFGGQSYANYMDFSQPFCTGLLLSYQPGNKLVYVPTPRMHFSSHLHIEYAQIPMSVTNGGPEGIAHQMI